MTIFEMLEQSGIITLLGMGIVFSFLVILVFAISLAGKVINRFVKEPAVQSGSIQSGQRAADSDSVPAVIAAAVHNYRNKLSK